MPLNGPVKVLYKLKCLALAQFPFNQTVVGSIMQCNMKSQMKDVLVMDFLACVIHECNISGLYY